ncbi:MAG TPA: hypothetical protein VEC75_07445 [Stellaceae bacterium]|nr:hypothetical protein [Stellaceae bacterium]
MSYNGGPGGINRGATPEERAAERDRHVNATHAQTQHQNAASNDPRFRQSVNHGNPSLAATSQPGHFGNGAGGGKGTGGNGKGKGGQKTVSNTHGNPHPAGTGQHPPGNGQHPQNHPNGHSGQKGNGTKGSGEPK